MKRYDNALSEEQQYEKLTIATHTVLFEAVAISIRFNECYHTYLKFKEMLSLLKYIDCYSDCNILLLIKI